MFKLSECISNEIITYPVIRSLKGKYRLTDAEIASIIGDKAYQTYAKKLNCESEFSSSNMINLYNYFKSRERKVLQYKDFFLTGFSQLRNRQKDNMGGQAMTNLMITNTMTSMQIAEVTGKQHAHVMRDIRDEAERLEVGGVSIESKFGLVEYIDAKGEKRPCYKLTKEGVLQLAARYDAVTRAKLIEIAMRQDKQLPSNYKEALLALVAAEEEKEQLQIESAQQKQIIGELKPKADYMDTILKNKGLVTITQIAKDYGMSGTKMNELLHGYGVQYKQSEQWLLYTKYQDKGYTHSETINIIRRDGRPDITMNTKWTQKGRLFIYDLLKMDGILPVIEQIVA